MNLIQFFGTVITETAGQIAAAFSQFFNVASPTGTMKAITNVVTCTTNTDMRGTDGAYTGTPPTVAAIADAVMDETATGHTGALKDVYDNAIQIGAAGAGLTALPAALLATVADGTLTVADSLKLSNAANAGKTAGPVPGTAGTVTLLNTAGTKTRVSTSVDTSGYRTTNPTLDLS